MKARLVRNGRDHRRRQDPRLDRLGPSSRAGDRSPATLASSPPIALAMAVASPASAAVTEIWRMTVSVGTTGVIDAAGHKRSSTSRRTSSPGRLGALDREEQPGRGREFRVISSVTPRTAATNKSRHTKPGGLSREGRWPADDPFLRYSRRTTCTVRRSIRRSPRRLCVRTYSTYIRVLRGSSEAM